MADENQEVRAVSNIPLDIRLVFDHKGGAKNPAFGHIGAVDFTASVVDPTLNGSPLGARSIKYLVAYGLRKVFADVFAQAESAKDAKEKFAARVAKVIAGTMSSRRKAMDEFDRLFIRIVDDKFAEWSGMTVDKFYESLGPDKIDDADKVYNEFFESAKESVEPLVKRLIEEQRTLEVKTAKSFQDVIAEMKKA
jgi:hypothetical protein